MRGLKQVKAQDILSTNYVIKFFDDERYAERLFDTGEMLFRPIKSFIESKQSGRGDENEGKVNCHYSLYCKEEKETLYKKLIDVTAVHLNVNRPIYCYYQLRTRNFHPNGEIYLNPKMLKDFSSGKQTYCAILERTQFENKIMDYLKKYDIGATIANVKYSNDDMDANIVLQTQAGKSDLAYFQKSKAYEEQQERRIILGEPIDSLVERGVGEKFRDGIKIKIGNLSKMGYIGKPVNFY